MDCPSLAARFLRATPTAYGYSTYSKDPAVRERNVKVPRVSKVLGGFKRNHGRRSVGDLPVIYITCSISVISTYMIHTV